MVPSSDSFDTYNVLNYLIHAIIAEHPLPAEIFYSNVIRYLLFKCCCPMKFVNTTHHKKETVLEKIPITQHF